MVVELSDLMWVSGFRVQSRENIFGFTTAHLICFRPLCLPKDGQWELRRSSRQIPSPGLKLIPLTQTLYLIEYNI